MMEEKADWSFQFRRFLIPLSLLLVFILMVILPKEMTHRLLIRLFYYLAVLSLIAVAFLARKNNVMLGLMPFVFFFLYSLYHYGMIKQYFFGVDDAYYYSYLPSIFVDHDLEFENQLQFFGVPASLIDRKTSLGFTLNEFPVGPAICWMPFYLTGHLVTGCFNLFGCHFSMNGSGGAYLNAVVVGNLAYAMFGLILVYLLVIRMFPVFWGSVATSAMWLSTPLYYYGNLPFLASESLSLMACSALFLLSWKMSKTCNSKMSMAAGLFGALACMIRLQNVIFLLVPFLLILRNKKGKAEHLALFLLAFLIGFLPQVAIWKRIMGSWILPAGTFLVYPANPFVLEVLFSARNGLFPCNPILAFCVAGFLCWIFKNRNLFSMLLLLVFLLNVYINASLNDWWGEVSFGARRFLGCTSIFALGFAAFSTSFSKKPGWKGAGIAFLLILFFAPLNIYLRRTHQRGKTDPTHSIRFSQILNEKAYFIYKPVVYLCELPIQVYYALRFGTHLYHPVNEIFIGEDIFYFEKNYGNLLSGEYNPVFGPGWESSVRKMNSTEAILYVPLHLKTSQLRIAMEMEYYVEKKPTGPLFAKLFLNGEFLRSFRIMDRTRTITIPLHKYKYTNSVNALKIESPFPVILEQLTFLDSQ